MSDRRYTLREAREELTRAACATYGHSWDVVETLGSGPVQIACHCGAAHPVGRYATGSASSRDQVRQQLAELTAPRFHSWCGQTHTPGPCADGVLRPEPEDAS